MRKFSMNVLAVLAVTVFAAVATAQPASFLDLGDIGPAGTFVFDTNGSVTAPSGTNPGGAGVDTELGLYDATGTLLAENDDANGVLQSEITATLAPGQYFLAVSEFNTVFSDGFDSSTGGFEAGDIADLVLNIDGAFGGTLQGGGDGTGLDQVVYFGVTVSAVPEPATGAVIALCGLAGLARRRRA